MESAQTLASIASGNIDRSPSITRDGFERLRLGLPVEQVGRRSSGPEHITRGIHRAKHDEAIRIRIRQRTRKHRITNAEDRGVRADANGKAQHGDDSRDAAALERPK